MYKILDIYAYYCKYVYKDFCENYCMRETPSTHGGQNIV